MPNPTIVGLFDRNDVAVNLDLKRKEFHQVSENEFLVDSGLPIHEMRTLAGLVLKDEDVTTVGG